ncbi:MAG: hypothetical protein ACOYN4_01800 [Bacteroidales bacterium]
MTHFTKFFLFIVCFSFGSAGIAQTIKNIKPLVFGNTIDIQYKVSGLKLNETLTVSLYVSNDGGSTYQGPMLEVKGDVGEKIFNGQHTITWEALKEMAFADVNTIFDIRAEVVSEKIKRSFFVAYSGNLTTPIGLRIGQLGGLGWYITAQSNTNPTLTGSYTYTDGTITDYNQFAWYEFTSNHKVSAYMACAGLTYQLARKLYMYGGAGYGKVDNLYEINEYSYDGDAPLGTDYGRDSKTSIVGVALDAGLTYKIGKLTLIGGASSIGFAIPDFQAGIGYSF